MKNFKKIASAIAALSLAACMVAPVAMTSFAAGDTGSITITNPNKVQHTYQAYQIFSGDLSGTSAEDYVLSNIKWADGVNASSLVTALKGDVQIEYKTPAAEGGGDTTVSDKNPFADIPNYSETADTSAKAVADILPTLTSNGVKQFLEIVGKNLKTVSKEVAAESADGGETYGNVTIDDLEPGYYFIKDKDASLSGKDDAYTRYMVKVLGTESSVAPKSAKPTVDKQVWDNDTGTATDETVNPAATEGDGGFWGETADHAIGKQFKFKLIANMAGGEELDAYKAYKVMFTDTMSTGVTLEDIESVKIIYNAGDPTTLNKTSDYTTDFTAWTGHEGTTNYDGDGTRVWTLTIDDIVGKLAEGKKLSDVKSVEVVYTAHLNAEAEIEDISIGSADYTSDTKNENKVKLTYSNNPNSTQKGTPGTDTGETPEDSTWVFTYEVDNNKTGEDDATLAGAKFKLYSDASCTTAVDLIYDTALNAYRPLIEGASEVADSYLISGWNGTTATESNGTFNIKGLDAGTYYLREEEAPSGYNKLEEALEVTISATHEELASPESVDKMPNKVTVSKDDSKNVDNTIKNQKGASLPSTGGIGTTLFYLGGGALVAVAGVMLITKKRMTKE